MRRRRQRVAKIALLGRFDGKTARRIWEIRAAKKQSERGTPSLGLLASSAHIRSASSPWTSFASNASAAVELGATAVTACWRGLGPTSPCPICSSPVVMRTPAGLLSPKRRAVYGPCSRWPLGKPVWQILMTRPTVTIRASGGSFAV